MSIDVDAVGIRIFSEFKDAAGNAWDKWNPDVKKLAEECALDAGRLAVMALSGKDVSVERAHISAQLANLKIIGKMEASKALWDVAAQILTRTAALLIK